MFVLVQACEAVSELLTAEEECLAEFTMVRIDQHGPEGKALQNAVKSKLRDYLGADYSDEASRLLS